MSAKLQREAELETHILVVVFCWNHRYKPILMTGRLCLRSSLAFIIDWRVVNNKQFFSKRQGAQMYDDINGIFCYALSRCGACTLLGLAKFFLVKKVTNSTVKFGPKAKCTPILSDIRAYFTMSQGWPF